MTNRPAIEFLKRAEQAFAGKSFTVRQLIVLMYLGDVRARAIAPEGVKLRDLSAATEIHKPALHRAVVELSARGMVTRTRGRKDGRDSFLAITERGVELLATAAGVEVAAPAPGRGM
jgi:DNA-binding MarR family transcriptional regulator